MRVSVIIRTKDEASRLRLTLASLVEQTEPAEIVVVNDGSSDDTRTVIEEYSGTLSLVAIHNTAAQGRSEASNIGARAASGDILIFLDGDTLVGPEFVVRHLALHRTHDGLIGRGETWHLRATRFFADPETLTPMPGEVERVARMRASELDRARVSREIIRDDFARIVRNAQPGIYPGAGPRILYDLEMAALREAPDCPVLWAAASGSNQSGSRTAFLAAGGFDAELSINEHRELALRLCKAGARMRPVEGAHSFHMTHRSGWRDPLVDRAWERHFYAAHPDPAVALLGVLWGSLSEPPQWPSQAQIATFPALAQAAERCAGIVGLDRVRQAHLGQYGLDWEAA